MEEGQAGHEASVLQGFPAELPQVFGPQELLLQADRQEDTRPQVHDPGLQLVQLIVQSCAIQYNDTTGCCTYDLE